MSKPRDERYTVAVDFDGVLHSYTSPWVNPETIPDPPVDGAIEWLREISKDFQVVIFTTRGRTDAGRAAVIDWLLRHGALEQALNGNGVEPLSEEVEAKIGMAHGPVLAAVRGDGIHSISDVLRAFAREIRSEDAKTIDALRLSHPGEGTILCTCSSYPHNPNCGLDQRLIVARADLLASQESARSLAEALAKTLQLSAQGKYQDGDTARRYLVDIEALTLKALLAYREAGRGKP